MTVSIQISSFCCTLEVAEVKIDLASVPPRASALADGLSPGIFPYLGASVRLDELRSVVAAYGSAVVTGKRGARLAVEVPGVLIDPAAYFPPAKDQLEGLFDYDDWLMRQRAAGAPLILTDTPRIPDKDQSALRTALARWDSIDEPTLVVLPIEPWWLRDGLSWLIEEVRAAARAVALVLLHRYNGLDLVRAVAGLLAFISEVEPVPVVLLRCDISAVGAVAHGAYAGFVGWTASTRHGPLPMRQPKRTEDDHEQDDTPSVLVPALHTYFKTSALPAFARIRRPDVLRCDDSFCAGQSLLEIAERGEVDPRAARTPAGRHNMATTEQIARHVLSAAEPQDAWWETCRAGAEMRASLAGSGISLPSSQSRWLRQWLDLGSPSHHFETVR
jgi:hypothetical protein